MHIYDDFNGAEFVGPLPFVVSEDERNCSVMEVVESVPFGVVREDGSIRAELGDLEWTRRVVRARMKLCDARFTSRSCCAVTSIHER